MANGGTDGILSTIKEDDALKRLPVILIADSATDAEIRQSYQLKANGVPGGRGRPQRDQGGTVRGATEPVLGVRRRRGGLLDPARHHLSRGSTDPTVASATAPNPARFRRRTGAERSARGPPRKETARGLERRITGVLL